MKKIVLFMLVLVFVSTLFAHDAWMRFPLIGADTPEDDAGFRADYMSLGWWGADYGFHLDLSTGHGYHDVTFNLAHAFKTIPIGPVTFLFGKDEVPFGRISNPSGFANLNYIRGHWWGSHIRNTEWMFKFKGDVAKVNWQVYLANEYNYWATNVDSLGIPNEFDYSAMNAGFKLGYNVAGADVNFALKMSTLNKTQIMLSGDVDIDSTMDWAFGLDYTAAEMVAIALQVATRDDGIDDTDDLGYYAILNYAPGFDAPVVGNIKPYFGYATKVGAEGNWNDENDMFFGLNMTPVENVRIKLEYLMESDMDDDSLDLVFGFGF